MKGALILVVAVGLGIGLLLPREQAVVAVPTPAEEAPVKTVRTPARATPAAASAGWGGETRLRPAPNGHFFATAQVNGQPIRFIVDTGATTVALTVDDARRAGIAVDPSRFEVVGTGASGPVRGHPVTIQTISLDGKEARSLNGAVLEGLEVSLLGQTFLSRFDEVRISGGEMILR